MNVKDLKRLIRNDKSIVQLLQILLKKKIMQKLFT